jgi:hypothetical protein
MRSNTPADRRVMTPQNTAAVSASLAQREAHLGTAGSGARLVFRAPRAEGFVVQALLECKLHPHPVASWQCAEIAGRETHEILEAPGTYLLHVTLIYTSHEPIEVELGFKLAHCGSTTQMLQFAGKLGDVHRAIALATIC